MLSERKKSKNAYTKKANSEVKVRLVKPMLWWRYRDDVFENIIPSSLFPVLTRHTVKGRFPMGLLYALDVIVPPMSFSTRGVSNTKGISNPRATAQF